jgi:hypothetical protein
MALIYYTQNNNGIGERLQKAINAAVPEELTEVYRSLESLSQRLCQLTYKLKIAVLLAASREELLGILSIRDLLDDIRIILILPDREKKTVSEGLRLYPRFFTYVDSNFNDVTGVLEKMMKHMNINK